MKKIFTLLFAVGFLTAIHAQSGSRDNRDYRDNQQSNQWGNNHDNNVVGNNSKFDSHDRYDNNFGYYDGNIKMQIARINQKYDFKIQQVRNNFFMRRYEKMRTIRSLEEQRKEEIRMAFARSSRWGQHDRDYDSNHHY
jgi:hypothetical protein